MKEIYHPKEGSPDKTGVERLLIERAKRGEREAFAEIVRRYQDSTYNFAWYFSRSDADALDMSQELFVHVFQKLGQFEYRSAFSTWLMRVAAHFFLNYTRRERRREVLFSDVAEDAPSPAEFVSDESVLEPLEQMTIEEIEQTVRHALEALPARYRIALILYYFEKKSYEEIASILSLPSGTVKSHIHRGKEILKRALRHMVEVEK